jgi:alpha-L-fucosidase
VKGGSFGENYKYNAREIRFTTKSRSGEEGPVLYAIALGWPEDRTMTVRSLAKPAGENINNITGVSLLGYDGKLDWKQTPEGLIVTLPEKKVSEYTTALKILGSDLKPVSFAAPTPAIKPNNRGVLMLDPDSAELHGNLKVEQRQGKSNIGFWDNASDSASWKVDFTKPGKYRITAQCALPDGESQLSVVVPGTEMVTKITATGNWDRYTTFELGTAEISKTGVQEIKVSPGNSWKAVNLREVKIAPVK